MRADVCPGCGEPFNPEFPDAHDGHDDAQFDTGYEGVDESTPPPGYCQEAWDYCRGLLDDPMTVAMGAPVDEFLEDFDRKHYAKCETCRKRMDLERMP